MAEVCRIPFFPPPGRAPGAKHAILLGRILKIARSIFPAGTKRLLARERGTGSVWSAWQFVDRLAQRLGFQVYIPGGIVALEKSFSRCCVQSVSIMARVYLSDFAHQPDSRARRISVLSRACRVVMPPFKSRLPGSLL
jgi:hypothetical protein